MIKIKTRYGDGTPLELSERELRQDLAKGTEDAAECADVPALSKEESATTGRAGGMRKAPRRGRGHALLVVADF